MKHASRSRHAQPARALAATLSAPVLALALGLDPGPALAGGVPVIDAAAITHHVKDAAAQAAQLKRLATQLAAITGRRDVGWILQSLANSGGTAGLGRNATLDGTLEALRAGTNTASAISPGRRPRIDTLLARFDLDGRIAGAAASQTAATRSRAEIGAAAIASAALAGEIHDRAAALGEDIRSRQAARTGGATDLKGAVDENTAAVLQLTALMSDLVRLQAGAARLAAARAAAETRAGLADAAFFGGRRLDE